MESKKEQETRVEQELLKIDSKIESLKIQYNLFFSGEINVPPEMEREKLGKVIRKLLNTELKSARVNLLSQNISSKFNLYNNMWKKKLNQLESGELLRPSNKRPSFFSKDDFMANNKKAEIAISLNREETFENLYKTYSAMNKIRGKNDDGEDLINKIKLKLISENIVDAKIELRNNSGKVKIKIKKNEKSD